MTTDQPEFPGGAVEVCLNITHGVLERSVSASYRTQSVSATGILSIDIILWLTDPLCTC